MSLITNRQAPADVPTTNALAGLAEEVEFPGPVTIRFGNANLFEMDEPLRRGEHIKVQLVLKRRGGAFEDVGDDDEGETTRAMRTRLVSAKLVGDPYTPPVETVKPKVDEDQPALYEDADADGEPDEDQGDDDSADTEDALPGYDGPR